MFRNLPKHSFTSIAVLTVLAACVSAQEPESALPAPLALEITMTKEVTTEKGGRQVTEYVKAERSFRGDILRFVIAYTNRGATDLTEADIVDPIPTGTVYIADSAEGTGTVITFSADGGKTFAAPPLQHVTRKADGTTVTTNVGPEAYTHVKWTVSDVLKPGDAGQVSFRARVK